MVSRNHNFVFKILFFHPFTEGNYFFSCATDREIPWVYQYISWFKSDVAMKRMRIWDAANFDFIVFHFKWLIIVYMALTKTKIDESGRQEFIKLKQER